MTNKTTLNIIITHGAKMLEPYLNIADPYATLYATAVCESAFGSYNVPRFEPAYAPNGKYFQSSEEQKKRYEIYGALSCCSYSSFQIMYPTACELGFDTGPWTRNPALLNNDEIAIFYVIQYLRYRVISRNPKKIEDIPEGYNTGSFSDSITNPVYVKKWMDAYNTVTNTDYIKT